MATPPSSTAGTADSAPPNLPMGVRAALGASPERLLRDLRYLGLLFESLVIRDLRVYAQRVDADRVRRAGNQCPA